MLIENSILLIMIMYVGQGTGSSREEINKPSFELLIIIPEAAYEELSNNRHGGC